MTSFSTKGLPSFHSGDVLKARDLERLSEVLSSLRGMPGGTVFNPPDRACIVDEDIPGTLNSKVPSFGNVTLLRWDDEAERYYEASDDPSINLSLEEEEEFETRRAANHSEDEILKDTFAIIRWIDGHYHIFADCDPIAERALPA